MSLLGKTALVTGGSRGIGRAISQSLAEAGVYVVLTYHTRQQAANDVVQSIISAGGNAHALQMTLESATSITQTMQTAMHDGPVDILVNNAAITQEKPFLDLTSHDCLHMFATNLIGPFLCCQAVLPHMMTQRWGRIINLASIGGQWPATRQVHYGAAKAGIISLTRSLARLYAAEGITVNAVSPGLVDTEMVAQELRSDAGQAKVAAIPLGRIAHVEEIAAVVVFLASDEASYITGETVSVNGGMLCV